MTKKKFASKKGINFDLELKDSHTSRVYEDNDSIPRDSELIIRRVSMKKGKSGRRDKNSERTEFVITTPLIYNSFLMIFY